MFTKIRNILFICLIVFIIVIYFIAKPYYSFVTNELQIKILPTLFSSNVKQIDNSVNILLLGIAGGTHDGPNLSDSIMVAHYNFETDHLTTIGIPRDIWSSTIREKINAAYAFGEAKQPNGGGAKLAKAELGAVVGMPIQYSVVIDFAKFKDLIDYLGGIDINIEHPFVDNEFPIEGKENDLCNGDKEYRCRYETLTFKKGVTHMDGSTALKFVRSRHAEGDEGSDFARSKRQQLMITAIKEKAVGIVKSGHINKIKGLYEKANSLVKRDVTNQQLATIARDILFSKKFKQTNLVLPEDLFIVPNYDDYDGRYVLIPSKDWSNVHNYFTCLVQKENNDSCKYLVQESEENK